MTDATVGNHLASEVTGDRAVIRIGLRLDALEAHELRAMLDVLLLNGLLHLVVDLSRTEFIDSAGLASLIRAMTVLNDRDGEIELVRPRSENAWRVFRLTKFDEVFTIHTALPATAQTALPVPAQTALPVPAQTALPEEKTP
jgi:anti-sigma B factor antagonist